MQELPLRPHILPAPHQEQVLELGRKVVEGAIYRSEVEKKLRNVRGNISLTVTGATSCRRRRERGQERTTAFPPTETSYLF